MVAARSGGAHFFWNGTFANGDKQRLRATEFGRRNRCSFEGRSGYLNASSGWISCITADDILYKCDR